MQLSRELIEKGNSWIDGFLLTGDNSKLVQLVIGPKRPAQAIAHFKRYANEQDMANDVNGRVVKVEYQRMNLKNLAVDLEYDDQEMFYAKVFDAINSHIAWHYGEAYKLELSDIDLKRCSYNQSLSTIAVVQDHPFWYDCCFIRNSKK